MYHRVADLDYDSLQLSVSSAHFEEHMQVINKLGRPVKIKDMVKNLKRCSFDRKEIVVSFDDGYSDNSTNAKSILERNGIPATFYIMTSAIGSKEEFFTNALEKSVLAPNKVPEVFEVYVSGKSFHWQINDQGACKKLDYSQIQERLPSNNARLTRSQLYFALAEITSILSAQEKKSLLQQVSSWSGQSLTPRPSYLPMTSDELISLADSELFEIGAHTISHSMLSDLPLEEQKKEIFQSKHDLEALINRPITSFSYPFGNYSEDTVRLVKEAKFENACTVAHQPVMRNTNPYLLPRFSVLDCDGEQFEHKLYEWLNKE